MMNMYGFVEPSLLKRGNLAVEVPLSHYEIPLWRRGHLAYALFIIYF